MKKLMAPMALLVLQVFLILSCKSTPSEQPVQPAEEKSAQSGKTALDGFNEAAARAEAARKRAADFESSAYFPSDWEAAEAQYSAAGALPKSSDAGLQDAAAAFNAAADTYDDLFGKTIPLYAQAREDEITAVRDALIAAGFTAALPEYLRAADETALAALSQYEAEDYYQARDAAAKALAAYQTLEAGAAAYLVRQEIVDRGFDSYDTENFDKAEEIAVAALDAYDAGDFAAAGREAGEATLRYKLVLSTGWAGYAADQRTAASMARDRVLEIKANIAAKDIFLRAEEIYNRAEAGVKAENYEDAASLYAECKDGFTEAGETALEKRRIADEAIKAAGSKIEESDETGRQAELVIQGGSK